MEPAMKTDETDAVPMPLNTQAKPNIVTAGTLLACMSELRELSLMKPRSAISLQVFLAYDELQAIISAATRAYNDAGDDKRPVMDTELELSFQPFPIEQFSGDSLSAASYTKLKGWLLTSTAEKIKVPSFGREPVH